MRYVIEAASMLCFSACSGEVEDKIDLHELPIAAFDDALAAAVKGDGRRRAQYLLTFELDSFVSWMTESEILYADLQLDREEAPEVVRRYIVDTGRLLVGLNDIETPAGTFIISIRCHMRVDQSVAVDLQIARAD